jgi:glucose-6-phosphate isomerase
LASEHHRVVLLNLRAQAKALARGRNAQDTRSELAPSLRDSDALESLLPHRTFQGNVPNSTLWIDALTPERLGALVALYEHKVFCQSIIWGIFAFDQGGVELGKSMAKAMESHTSL